MKETEGFSIRLFAEKCKGKQGRARLAAAVGLLAMLLILLSELFPQTSAAGSTQKAKSAQSSAASIASGGQVLVNFLEFCQKDGEYFLKT